MMCTVGGAFALRGNQFFACRLCSLGKEIYTSYERICPIRRGNRLRER